MSNQKYDVTHHADGKITLTPSRSAAVGCGGFLALILAVIIQASISVFQTAQFWVDSRLSSPKISSAANAFPKGEFLLIEVEEENGNNEDEQSQRRKRLEKACEGKYDRNKPLVIGNYERLHEYTHKFFSLSGVQVDGMPSPTIMEESGYMETPYYALFKGPNALEKLRKWGHDNGYPETDLDLKVVSFNKPEWELGTANWSFNTNKARFAKPGSNVSIVAYFKVGSRTYLWNGSSAFEFEIDPEEIKVKQSVAQ